MTEREVSWLTSRADAVGAAGIREVFWKKLRANERGNE